MAVAALLSSKMTSSDNSMVEVSTDSIVFAELTREHVLRRRGFVPIPVNSQAGLS